MRISIKFIMLVIAAIFSLTGFAVAAERPDIINVSFSRHVDFPVPMPVQDVYVVLNDSTPDIVYRANPLQSKDPMVMAKEAYATTNHTPHDPHMETSHPVGPFPRGADLNFTLGDWLSATGSGTYTLKNGNATMNFTFHNLVPNGTYTVWWAGVVRMPEYRFVVAPAGALNGSENAFKADTEGNAAFHLDLPALPAGTNETRTLIVVRYHSDGKIPGQNPGEYGKTAHVQLLYLMPLMETKTTAAAEPAQKQPGYEGVLAIIGLNAAAFIALRSSPHPRSCR
jgi:hypothetical protein